MKLKRCVRCGRLPHDPDVYPDCPQYVPPASRTRKAVNRILGAPLR